VKTAQKHRRTVVEKSATPSTELIQSIVQAIMQSQVQAPALAPANKLPVGRVAMSKPYAEVETSDDGWPQLRVYENGEDSRGFAFRVRKAKILLAALSDGKIVGQIKHFVEKYGDFKPETE